MTLFQARTDVGCRRSHNEDAYFCDTEVGLFVVADGVGGRAAGEVASALCTQTFQEAANDIHRALKRYSEAPTLETRNLVLERLDETCQQSSRRIYEAAEVQNHRGMTTTLVAVAVAGGMAFVCHVGDSRVYLVRDGHMQQLTEDHSMINELVRSGQMKPEDAARSRYRNVITRAIGLHPQVQPDLLAVEVLPGDRLILNSDGLSDVVPHALLEKLSSLDDLDAAATSLLEETLNRGAPDNVTLVILQPEASPQVEAAIARARVMEHLFLFEDLPFHARLRVSRICDEVFFTPGQVIVSQAEPGQAMYVVVQGEVTVGYDGIELARLGAGEHFGEISLADEKPRSATVAGFTFGSLIVIHKDHLMDFCRREPDLGNEILWKLLRTLGARLREANERISRIL